MWRVFKAIKYIKVVDEIISFGSFFRPMECSYLRLTHVSMYEQADKTIVNVSTQTLNLQS